MLKKSKSPFYMDDHPNYSSQYIFDEAYQNVMKKKRFEKNPKFMYFNTVLKMKSKLENSQHDIFTKVFDKNHKRQVSDTNRFNETAQTWTNNSFNKLKPEQKKQSKHKRNISCIQEINFQVIRSPRNGSIYSQRPRLDDIMAEYRKMNKTGNAFRQKSFRTTSNKPNNKLQFLNKQAAKHLPKSPSLSIRKSQGY